MDADLVLEGGGVKGIALVGAYTALSEAGNPCCTWKGSQGLRSSFSAKVTLLYA